MRTFTQTLKFICLEFALVLANNPVSAGTWSTGSGDGEKHDGTWYVLYVTAEQTIGLWDSKDYDLAGPGARLTFDARHTYLGAGNLRVSQNQGTSVLYEGNPGISHLTSVDYGGYGPYSLDENTSTITFYAPTGVTGDKKFKNVKVTMASYCKYDNTEAISFGTGNYMVQSSLDKKIIWSNISDKDITITGTDKDRFSISLTKVGCSAGKWGNTVVTVTYKRDKYDGGREHTATLNVNGKSITLRGTTIVAAPSITECATASEIPYQSAISGSALTPGTAKHPTRDLTIDGTWTWQNTSLTADAYKAYTVVFTPDAKYGGGYSTQTCAIAIPVTKLDQTITWDLTENVEYATGQLMGATATSGMPVTYTSNHPEWGYINGNGRLVVVEPNKEITITATQAGNDNWNAAPDVTKTFITKGAHPGLYTEDVHASDITYGDLLSASVLTGDVLIYDVIVPGTLEWVDPIIMPNAGTANHMVLFTPENTEAYSEVYFELPVTVAKADPVFAWHISDALHEHTRFHHFVTSSNTEAGLTCSVSNSTYIEIEDEDVLHTKEVESAQSGLVITVVQEETANYNGKTETMTVTVYPKVEQCLPAVVDNKTTMDHMGSVFNPANSGSWCDVTNVEETTYLSIFGVKYTQYEGIRLGKWSDGFSGIKSFTDFTSLVGHWNLVPNEKSIELTFTGIPDSISFSAVLQTVQYDLFGWHTAPLGNPNPSWTIYEKPLGGVYTEVTSLSVSDTASHNIKAALKPTTRFVKITLNSVFAGFAQNVKITRKQYIKTDVPSLTFGTDTHPLQRPQTLTLMYSSIGECNGECWCSPYRLPIHHARALFRASVRVP